MTGEISLKGKAMAIGGLKEKSMAAYKSGCDTVIIPKDNEKDLDEISYEVKSAVSFVSVSEFDEVLHIALDGNLNKSNSNNKPSVTITNKKTQTSVITQ